MNTLIEGMHDTKAAGIENNMMNWKMLQNLGLAMWKTVWLPPPSVRENPLDFEREQRESVQGDCLVHSLNGNTSMEDRLQRAATPRKGTKALDSSSLRTNQPLQNKRQLGEGAVGWHCGNNRARVIN